MAVEFFGSCEVAPLDDDAEGENAVCRVMKISYKAGTADDGVSYLFHADRQVQPHSRRIGGAGGRGRSDTPMGKCKLRIRGSWSRNTPNSSSTDFISLQAQMDQPSKGRVWGYRHTSDIRLYTCHISSSSSGRRVTYPYATDQADQQRASMRKQQDSRNHRALYVC